MFCFNSSESAAVMSVSMKPGAMALTVMLRLAISWASDLVKSDQAGLRRYVIRLAGIAGFAHDRRDVDDAAPALLHHALHHLLNREKRAGEVGREHRVPIVLLHAQRQAVLGYGGVVHQDVDRAGFGEGFFDGLLRRQIDGHPSGTGDGGGGGFEFRGVARG